MLNNPLSILAIIGKDKWMHFTISLLIELFIFAVCKACGLGAWVAAPAFIIAFGAGFIKEKIDARNGGTFDNYDIVADFLGCFVGLVFIALVI